MAALARGDRIAPAISRRPLARRSSRGAMTSATPPPRRCESPLDVELSNADAYAGTYCSGSITRLGRRSLTPHQVSRPSCLEETVFALDQITGTVRKFLVTDNGEAFHGNNVGVRARGRAAMRRRRAPVRSHAMGSIEASTAPDRDDGRDGRPARCSRRTSWRSTIRRGGGAPPARSGKGCATPWPPYGSGARCAQRSADATKQINAPNLLVDPIYLAVPAGSHRCRRASSSSGSATQVTGLRR